ncbi:hypothetical protein [Bradyrhizobium sp. SYSU BS000235]|uniref:hypothetical protein n=1 Tax=Bradyrhizobium sp. SYSU BS000235 TaxID=3411332 RepID=UPI003C7192DE
MTDSSRIGVTQTIGYDASAAIANAFGPQTYRIRLVSNSACHVRIGDGAQTATVADPYLPANWETFVTVTPGQRISVIKAATGGSNTATAGTLWVTELQ